MVSGIVSAGANCTRAVSGEKTQIAFDELLDMLEPNEERGPAAIIPLSDFVLLKETLEKACVELKCKKEEKKKLRALIQNLDELQGVSSGYLPNHSK